MRNGAIRLQQFFVSDVVKYVRHVCATETGNLFLQYTEHAEKKICGGMAATIYPLDTDPVQKIDVGCTSKGGISTGVKSAVMDHITGRAVYYSSN